MNAASVGRSPDAAISQPHLLLRKLRGGFPCLRPHREMVPLAGYQSAGARDRAHPAASIRVLARQRPDVPDAGAGLVTAAEGLRGACSLWRPDRRLARTARARLCPL